MLCAQRWSLGEEWHCIGQTGNTQLTENCIRMRPRFIGLQSSGNGEMPKGGGREFWRPYSLSSIGRGSKDGFPEIFRGPNPPSEGRVGRAYGKIVAF
jgi:hypothetical protein